MPTKWRCWFWDRVHAVRVIARGHAKLYLFHAYGGLNYQIWTKVGMKKDMGVADVMALLVLGLCARSTCKCA